MHVLSVEAAHSALVSLARWEMLLFRGYIAALHETGIMVLRKKMRADTEWTVSARIRVC